MNAREAHLLVQQMIRRSAEQTSIVQFTRDTETLKAGGWKLGVTAYRMKRSAHSYQWRNIAHFYNGDTKERIFFWNNPAASKAAAERLASENPAPGGAQHFTDVIIPTIGPVVKNQPVEPPCPECEKLHAVKDKSQVIGEFLDWLQNEKKVQLCLQHEHTDGCFEEDDLDHEDPPHCGYHENELAPLHTSIEKLLAEFFEIDLAKVEDEKRALLEFTRKHQ